MLALSLVIALSLHHAPKSTECLVARDGGWKVSFSQFVQTRAATPRGYVVFDATALRSKDPVVTIIEFEGAKLLIGNEVALALTAKERGDDNATQRSGRIVVPVDGLRDAEAKVTIVTFPAARGEKLRKVISGLLRMGGSAVGSVAPITDGLSAVVDGLVSGIDGSKRVTVVRRFNLTMDGKGTMPLPAADAPLIFTDGAIDEYEVAQLRLIDGDLNRDAHGAVVNVNTTDWDDLALSDRCVTFLESTTVGAPRENCLDELKLTRAHRRQFELLSRTMSEVSSRPGLFETAAALRVLRSLSTEESWPRDSRPSFAVRRFEKELSVRSPKAAMVSAELEDVDALKAWLTHSPSLDACSDRRDGSQFLDSIDARVKTIPEVDTLVRVAQQRTEDRARACAGTRKLDPVLLAFVTAPSEPDPTMLSKVTVKNWVEQLRTLEDLPELAPRLINATRLLAHGQRDTEGVALTRAIAKRLLKRRFDAFRNEPSAGLAIALKAIDARIETFQTNDDLEGFNDAFQKLESELNARASELEALVNDEKARFVLPVMPPN